MAALRDLLEVYGALDEAAAADPAVAAALDEFLPHASEHTGWYREVEQFFFRENARRSPNLKDACSRIGEQASTGPSLSNPQKSRLLYGLSAAARIKQVTGTDALPSFDDPADEEFQRALDGVLAALGPEGKYESWQSRLENASNCKATYVAEAQTEFAGRARFDTLRGVTADIGMIDPAMQRIKLCQAVVRTVNGIQSVVVDTRTESDDITLTNLKKIVNPFNWADNYSDFFLRMDPFFDPHRPDGWRRVRETVGFRGFEDTVIITALKYYPAEGEGEARIDYDLDDPTPGPGDGQVLVDRGFINMWATKDRDPDQPGVGVRTRKVVHIKGLSPFAQQRLVCLTGYGTASNEFLFGPAADPPATAREFAYYEQGVTPQAGMGTDAEQPSTHVAATAVGLWTESVRDLTNDYFNLADKWMAGALTLTDVTDFSQQVTGHLVKAPLKFLERVNQPRNLRKATSNTQQDGGQ
jgi:hypothetical protein